MKILAIAGSNSENSINRQLVAHAAGLSRYEATVLDLTGFDDVPIYSPARQQRDGFPAEIQELFALIQAHDGILLASPEYNGSMPAVLKNVIDWLSRIEMKFLGNKPVLAMATSPGPNGGGTNLKNLLSLLPWWGAQLTGSYSLGKFYEHMSAGQLSNEETQKLAQEMAAFDAAVAAARVLQAA